MRKALGFRNRHYLLIDCAIFILAAAISFAIRLETLHLERFGNGLILFLAYVFTVKPIVFFILGMYSRYWTNAGPGELLTVVLACLVSGLVLTGIVWVSSLITPRTYLVPRAVPMIDMLLTLFMVGAARFSTRAYDFLYAKQRQGATKNATQVLIIGAGAAGTALLNSMQSDRHNNKYVVGFLDDDPAKQKMYVRGVRVLGKISTLKDIARVYKVGLVIMAIPSADGDLIRNVTRLCKEINVEHRILPGVNELIDNQVSTKQLRSVVIDDLLRRAPVKLDTRDIQSSLRGKRVLITGAGGSIGRELARQVAGWEPQTLLLLGHGENSLFATELALQADFPALKYQLLLADVRDEARLTEIFEAWRPEIVFHAAAHKHVPMLEANVTEAMLNNVVGTANVVIHCQRFDVERMIMISTDKAVNPTSVMGMTKRAAEMLVMHAAKNDPQRYAVVRFGNVLGSRGSVVPTFQEQIRRGGPITVTSESITRYFMSVPEAVLLVLKASTLRQEGPLFLLNMGDPVPIMQLAKDVIALSGLEPYRDIDIVVTGLRPGEKMYEELSWGFEERRPLENGALFCLSMQDDQLHQMLAEAYPEIQHLMALVGARSIADDTLREMLRHIVFSLPGAQEEPVTHQV
jgi:FlaA1/EpsC-like NDP-sugar epimerase